MSDEKTCLSCLLTVVASNLQSNMSHRLDMLTSKVEEGGDVEPRKQTAQIEIANTTAVYDKHGNKYDEMDMDRMGKLQELRVSNIDSRRAQT